MLKRLSFLLLFLKSSLANHSLTWACFLWSKVLQWYLIFLIDWRQKSLKNTIYGEHFYGFLVSDLWKPWKKRYSCQNKHSYTGHRYFEDLWSFILYIFVKVCFVFKKQSLTFVLSLKNSHYAYIPLYMHKTLPTLGNEKEQ